MAQIRPQIADVSHRAMWWWDNLVTMTTQRYQQWEVTPSLDSMCNLLR